MRTLILFLLLFSSVIHGRGVEKLEQIPGRISSAVAKQDLDSFLSLCSLESIFAKTDSCQRIVNQFMRKKFEMKILGKEIKGNAGQITLDLYRTRNQQKRRVDTIAFLCVKEEGRWLIYAITERKRDIKAFLDNPPPVLQPQPALLQLAEKLHRALETKDMTTIKGLVTARGLKDAERLAKRMQRRKAKFRPELLAQKNKSGQIGFVNGLVQRGKRLRQVGIFYVKKDGKLKADQFSSDFEYASAILNDTLEYNFDVKRLPSHAAALKLMQNFSKALQNKEQNIRSFYISKLYWSTAGLGTRRSQRFFEKARKSLQSVSEPKVYYHKKTRRAVAEMNVKYSEKGKTYNQKCYFYLMQQNKGFVIVDHNYGLGREWFYMKPR